MTNDSTTTAAADTVTEYLWVPDYWGDDVTAEEDAALCEAAEAYLTEHEGDGLSIMVRPCGEIVRTCGLHRRHHDGTWRTVAPGYETDDSGELETVRELTNAAFVYACETALSVD